MLVLCGVATLAGPNGTSPALENRRIEINPPPFPAGIELNLSRATDQAECSALAFTKGDMRCVHCPAQGPHTCTAPQARGSSLVCTPPWLEVLPRGRHQEDTPATALVLWCRCITRGRATAKLPALGEEADEPEADEPREVAFKQLRVFRARGRVVAQSAEHCRVQSSSDTADKRV